MDINTLKQLAELDLFEFQRANKMPYPMPMAGSDYFHEVIDMLIEIEEGNPNEGA